MSKLLACTSSEKQNGRPVGRPFCFSEEVGFEPTVRFPAHTLSKRAP